MGHFEELGSCFLGTSCATTTEDEDEDEEEEEGTAEDEDADIMVAVVPRSSASDNGALFARVLETMGVVVARVMVGGLCLTIYFRC